MTPTTTITGCCLTSIPPTGMTLWLMDREGRKYCCHDPFTPSFFLHVPETEKERIAAILRPFPFRIDVERALQREIYSDEEWNVLR